MKKIAVTLLLLMGAMTIWGQSVPTVVDTNMSACDSILWCGQAFKQTTVYRDTVWTDDSHAEVDSVFVLHLQIHQSENTIDVQEHCDTYTWVDGVTYTASTNSQQQTYTSIYGCDSVVTLHLTINKSKNTTDEQEHCDTYTWVDGITYTASTDTPQKQYTTQYGCDSVVTLHLTINQSTQSIFRDTACDSYTWLKNDSIYTTSGYYQHLDTTPQGCQHTDVLLLVVNDRSEYIDHREACVSYLWIDGQTYDASTETPSVTLVTPNTVGCDSVVRLSLTIHQPSASVETATACDSYTWKNGETYTSDNNSATVTYRNQYGCDSVVTLHLTVNHNSNTSYSDTACDSYLWNMDSNTYTNSGAYYRFYQTDEGCPSVDTLLLTIRNSNSVIRTESVCDSFIWDLNDTIYTNSQLLTRKAARLNVDDCDSVVTLVLTIRHKSDTVYRATVCDGMDWHETHYDASGVYSFDYLSGEGCSSVDSLYLTVNHNSNTSYSDTACDSYLWNMDSNPYTNSGTYYRFYQTDEGCPSVDTLLLAVRKSNSIIRTESVCDSFIWDLNGTIYNESGQYIDTAQALNGAGCDSVVTLILTIRHNSDTVYYATVCDGMDWYETHYDASGLYSFDYTSGEGCPSVDSLYLTVNYNTSKSERVEACDSYHWNDSTYSLSGRYTFDYPSGLGGCPSTDTLFLSLRHKQFFVDTQRHCNEYVWNDSTYYESTNDEFTYSRTYEEGCDSIVTLLLTIQKPLIVPKWDDVLMVDRRLLDESAQAQDCKWYLYGATEADDKFVGTGFYHRAQENGDYVVVIQDTLFSCPTAAEVVPSSQAMASPNPTQSATTISGGRWQKGERVVVVNMQGFVMMETVAEDDSLVHLDLASLPQGIYMVKIANEVVKVIKK